MLGYFDSCKVPVVCQIVNAIKTGLISESEKTYHQFSYDLLQVTHR